MVKVAVGLFAAAFLGNVAYAQAPDREAGSERRSVLQKPRPDYDPLGAHVGSFLLLPSVDVQESYDTNVYATASNEKQDFYTTVRPEVQLKSDWSNHALAFQASGDMKRYNERVTENVTNYATSVQGRLDVLRDSYLMAGAGYQFLHEDRSSPDAASTRKPVEYSVTSGNVGYSHERGVLGGRVNFYADSYDYKNGVNGSGASVLEDDRDRVEYRAVPRLSYEIVRNYNAFIETAFNWRDYSRARDGNGFNRDSHGYAINLGTAIDLTQVINGEVFAGYINQDYDDARLKTASGFGFGANLLWNITDLTSLRLAAAHTAEETTVSGASSYVQSLFRVNVEHELRRNILLTGVLGYTNQDYQGVSRSDDLYTAGVGLRYLLSRNLSARLDFLYSERNAGLATANFDRALTTAGLRLQF